jgi:hypothetical protein
MTTTMTTNDQWQQPTMMATNDQQQQAAGREYNNE